MHFKEGRSYEFLRELGVLTYWLEAAMKVFYSTQISSKLLPAPKDGGPLKNHQNALLRVMNKMHRSNARLLLTPHNVMVLYEQYNSLIL